MRRRGGGKRGKGEVGQEGSIGVSDINLGIGIGFY